MYDLPRRDPGGPLDVHEQKWQEFLAMLNAGKAPQPLGSKSPGKSDDLGAGLKGLGGGFKSIGDMMRKRRQQQMQDWAVPNFEYEAAAWPTPNLGMPASMNFDMSAPMNFMGGT